MKSDITAVYPDAKVRIRDNQRRSRLRRQEYIQGLEAKVQDYESRGVTATIEVQNAARGVLRENDHLRSENAGLRREISILNGRLQALSQVERTTTTSPSGLHSGFMTETTFISPRDEDERPQIESRCGTPFTDSLSCEHAAHIIAGLKSGASEEDISSDLGCDSATLLRSCRIDNSQLFSKIDQHMT